MPDARLSAGLWVLILGLVSFLSAFAGILAVLPPQLYGQYTGPTNQYDLYAVQSNKVSATTWNLYNSTLYNQTFTGTMEHTFGQTIIVFYWYSFPLSPASLNYMEIKHVTLRIPVINVNVYFEWLSYGPSNKDKLGLVEIFRDFYDNASDTAKVTWHCEHITLEITYSGADNKTLYDSLMAKKVYMNINYQLDISSMGLNMWQVLANVFTFQAIQTSDATIDILLNSFVSFPTWASFAYVAYKLITGVIPTLSGGGGS